MNKSTDSNANDDKLLKNTDGREARERERDNETESMRNKGTSRRRDDAS